MLAARRLTFFAIALVLCGAGCFAAPASGPAPRDGALGTGSATNAPSRPSAPASRAEAWHAVGEGIERSVIAVPAPDGVNVILYRLDPAQFEARVLHDAAAPKSVGEWAATLSGDALVVNGFYFHDDQLPSGFLAVDGSRVGDRAFDLDKSGLLALRPRLRIINTKTEAQALDAAALGTAGQSYPFFIIDGAPAIEKDSGQLSRRTFVGLDTAGRIYVGSVGDSIVSLHRLMRILDEQPIEWDDVLNLDGGESTGYFARVGRDERSSESFSPVPNVLVFTRRAAP